MSRKAKGLAAEWRAGDRWVGQERRAIWNGVDPDIALEAYDIATERLGGEWRSRSRALVEGATTIYREKARKARERLRRIERDRGGIER